MIKRITIENFQSHKKSTLDLDDGVNAIVGSSNNGKSAIIRGLKWLATNKPSGFPFASHWILDGKGSLTGDVKVEVETENGVACRLRAKNANTYSVNGNSFEAFGHDVPSQVDKTLGMTETSVQNQQDAPFMMSSSASDVGRYLNKIVNIDVIDKVLSEVDKRKREVAREKSNLESSNEKLSKEIDFFGFLDEARAYIKDVEVLQGELDAIKSKKAKLESEINKVLALKKRDFGFLEYAQKLVLHRERCDGKIKSLQDCNLRRSIERHDALSKRLKFLNDELRALEGELPDTCPYCNSPLK